MTFSILGQTNSPRYVGQAAISRAAKFLEEIVPRGAFQRCTEIRSAVQRRQIPGKCLLFQIAYHLLAISSLLLMFKF